MPDIAITRTHTLGRAKARDEVQAIARELESRLDVTSNWQGDTLHFNRPGADGTIDVSENDVVVKVNLGPGFGFFKGMVEGQIRTYLDQRFG